MPFDVAKKFNNPDLDHAFQCRKNIKGPKLLPLAKPFWGPGVIQCRGVRFSNLQERHQK